MKLLLNRRNFMIWAVGTSVLSFIAVGSKRVFRVHSLQIKGVTTKSELEETVNSCLRVAVFESGLKKFYQNGGLVSHSSLWEPSTNSLVYLYEFQNLESWFLWRKNLNGFFDESKFRSFNGSLVSQTRVT